MAAQPFGDRILPEDLVSHLDEVPDSRYLGKIFLLDQSNAEELWNRLTYDRNFVSSASVMPNGDIMFARWEHVADRNRFAIFRAKPDGTDLFVLYGAHSPGNSYLHPRDMDPKGQFPGQVVSSLMSLSGTQEGGSLQLINAASYSEYNTPTPVKSSAARQN